MTDTTKTAALVAREEQAVTTVQAELSEIERQIDSPQLDVDLDDATCTALGAKATAARMRLQQAKGRLVSAQEAHRMTQEAAHKTTATVNADGANECQRLTAKVLESLVPKAVALMREVAKLDQIQQSYADQKAVALDAAEKAGVTVDIVPFGYGAALAMALDKMSAAEGASYPRANLARWLAAVPDSTARAHEVLRLITGSSVPPHGLTVAEAADIARRTMDPQAPAHEAAERTTAQFRPIIAYNERVSAVRAELSERARLDGQPLRADEVSEFDSSREEPEKRAQRIWEARAKDHAGRYTPEYQDRISRRLHGTREREVA